MPSDYIDEVIGIVAVADAAAVNVDAAIWDPDTGGDQTVVAPRLSADGTEPATHIGFCQSVTSSMLTQMTTSSTTIGWNMYKASEDHTPASVLAAESLQPINAPA